MAVPIDELYFEWLYNQVANLKLRNPARTHWSLLRQLYSKEFDWFVPNDDNRAEDGKDIRREFLSEVNAPYDPGWEDLGCSMLELFIGIARRLSFEADGEPDVWFWHLIETLGLLEFSDKNYNQEAERVIDEALERVIRRTYDYDGRGGLFPLRNPPSDQRNVEIWYQLSAYLIELL
jgi:hypothetical protein